MSASAIAAENSVKKVYQSVIDEVITNVREAFLDEGYDEQILQELKQMWEAKLSASRAVQTSEEARNEPFRLPISTVPKNSDTGAKSSSQSMDSATRAAFQALPQSYYHGTSSSSSKRSNNLAGSQLDGGIDGSDSEDDEDDDELVVVANDDEDNDELDDKANDDDGNDFQGKEDSDPLNSGDDLTEPESPNSSSDLFDTDNVIVCQYDKVNCS